jgi:DNA-binding transcriptional ArsR family regulator
MVADQSAEITEEVIEAIASLGNETRLEILFALYEPEWEHHEWHMMTFTELYDAVDVGSSSQFSYHLDRLIGKFICETPEGYRLTYSGNKIARVISSGVYESTSKFESHELTGTCLFCENESLLAALEDERFTIRCTSCDAILITDFFPRSQTRYRSTSEIIESFGHHIWSMCMLLQKRICPECFGYVDRAVDVYENNGKTRPIHVNSCRECGVVLSIPIEVSIIFHPAVLHLFWEHDVLLLDIPLWEFFGYIVSDVIEADIVSSDPFEADFEITLDNKMLYLHVDEQMTVTSWQNDD